MSGRLKEHTACDLEQAKVLMADRIRDACASHASPVRSPLESAVVRLEIAVEDLQPLPWLAAQKCPAKTYWSSRESGFEMAGVGVADIISEKSSVDYGLLHKRLWGLLKVHHDEVRYYGGLRFDARDTGSRDALWSKFGTYRFVVPRFELSRQSGLTRFVCNIVFAGDRLVGDRILDELGDIISLVDSRNTEIPHIVARSDCPDERGWDVAFETALESIDKTELEKLVLARQTSFELSSLVNPIRLLQRLRQVTPGCCHFCFQLDDNFAFVGATPERLYQRAKRTIKSEAVAGTRPRGVSEDTDIALGKELLQSEKEMREHRYVVDTVGEALTRLCEASNREGDVSLLKLATVQHLITRFEGRLAADIADADILRALHPTPAVGGYPSGLAVEKIHEIEPFDRGWYTGPVGWVGNDSAEFAVAIRSGLVAGDRLHLFAGAGIVEGSTAESEWSEIENKLSSFTKVFDA